LALRRQFLIHPVSPTIFLSLELSCLLVTASHSSCSFDISEEIVFLNEVPLKPPFESSSVLAVADGKDQIGSERVW
jgi:hypothetical protein